MTWRHELKYIIDEATFQQLYFTLRPILHGDHHATGDDPAGFLGYQIRSLYFDDEARTGIFDKLAGVDPRHKYRIRIYNDNDRVIHLEKKIKSGNMTQKQSCRLTRFQVDALLDGEPEVLLEDPQEDRLPASSPVPVVADKRQRNREKQLLYQFYADIRSQLLKPLILVDYDRTPLVWPDGNVRITFDRHLSTGFYRQDLWDPAAALQPVLEPGALVMEVKFDNFLPDFIRALLPLAGASPLAISKYVQCAGFCRMHNWEDQI